MSAPGEIGYLVSMYPATSHTFVRREVEALRRLGLPIATFSVRRPDTPPQTDRERAAAAETGYILPLSPGALFGAHLRAVFRHPVRYARTFALALRHRVPGARALLWSAFHFAEAIVLAHMLERRNVARLHSHFANSGAVVGLLATRFLELPWSLTLHGISETDYPAGLLLADKIAAADFVACVSWFGRAQAMRLVHPVHWPKLAIVRCGIDMRDVDEHRQASAPAPRPLAIVCVGRLSAEKGQSGLIEAVAGVRARGIAATLTLVGYGPDRALLDAAVDAAGLGEQVTFAGRLDEGATLEAIARADLLVLPSFMEGLPVVLMEAMALGVPVIGPRVAGVPELIEDGVSGLLFTPGNWADLADAIARFADDRAFAAACAERAAATIASEFDIDRAVAPLLDYFRAAAAQHAVTGGTAG